MTTTQRPQRKSRRSRRGPGDSAPPRDIDRIRWSKITTAQTRMSSGYYDRDDVQESLVAALLQEFKRH